jgi:PAS domain S-box-containing protein
MKQPGIFELASHCYGGGATTRKQDEDTMRLQNAALEAAANAIVITDQSGDILWVNAAFSAFTGYSAQEVLGRNPRLLKSGKQEEAFYRNLWQTISSGQVWRGEMTNRRKDGSLYTEEMTITPVRSSDGTIVRYIAIKQDVSERKRAEEELKFKSIILATQQEVSIDGILVVDENGIVLSCNRRFVEMWGIPAELIEKRVDKNLLNFVLDQLADADSFRRGVQHLYEHRRETRRGEIMLKGGRVFDRYTAPMFGTDDRYYGRVWYFRDITERKKAEVELENIHMQLLEFSRSAGMAEIACNVLHNVGNVLNGVNVSTDLIAESVKKSKVSSLGRVVVLLQEHAQELGPFLTDDPRGKHVPAVLARLSEHLMAEQAKIAGELDSLRRNVEHIKEIVAMQQNYATVGGVKEVIDLASLVEDSLRLNEGALSRHGVEVVREIANVPRLNVEKHKILQILVNLVRNAKYACDESGRADRRLTVRMAHSDGMVKISVKDNGIGIPPENLTRIFNYGYTTRKGGHGFGLHSSALAAKEMGGSLTVDSVGPGQGTTFTLELPCPEKENPRAS